MRHCQPKERGSRKALKLESSKKETVKRILKAWINQGKRKKKEVNKMKRNDYFDYIVNNAAEVARAYENEMVDKVKENKDLEEIEKFAREYEKEMVEKFMAGYPVK